MLGSTVGELGVRRVPLRSGFAIYFDLTNMSFHVWKHVISCMKANFVWKVWNNWFKKTQNSINKKPYILPLPNFEIQNRLIWKGLVPYVIFSVVAKEHNSMLQKMPLLYPWQHFDLNRVTSQALKKQCELPCESFLPQLIQKILSKKRGPPYSPLRVSNHSKL